MPLKALKRSDVLTVWRLDRMGRSLGDLIAIVKEIESRGAGFRSLAENIDTTTPSGTLVFHLMGALAQFERSLIAERTKAGLHAAKKRGERLGRKPKLNAQQIRHARKLVNGGERVDKVAASLNVSYVTLYRAFHKQERSALQV
jgi:DNA invertase Pin-like site-specific DNA recombinase